MSINFHAYQNRGFLLSGFEEIKKQWERMFADFDPYIPVKVLKLERDEDYVYLNYYKERFRLRLHEGCLEKKLPDESMIEDDPLTFEPFEKGWTGNLWFNEAMSVYHILKYTKEFPRQNGAWVPNESLDPRAIGVDKRENILLDEFAAHYTGRFDLLEKNCAAFGGIPVASKADLAFEFYPFQETPLRLLYWEEDEEFDAKAQILVMKNITDYVNLETTGCMVSDLFERIMKLDEAEE